ncbi:MAG: hypothetical protein ACOCXQ_03240 [Patescibacteria group bacterium]
MNTMQQKKKNQLGWTTMEYVVGALIIVTVVVGVINAITGAIQSKGDQVTTVISQ